MEKLDIGFAGARQLPAIFAIADDRLVACRAAEIPLGRDFIADRLRIQAELMALTIKE
jgi:hypothetical protein